MSESEFYFDAAGVCLDESEAESTSAATDSPLTTRPASQAKARPAAASTRTGVDRHTGCSAVAGVLYFDLETIPDYDRLPSFGLDPVPEVPPEADLSGCPDAATVISGTVNDIKSKLRKFTAPAAWLDLLAAAETAGKNREGVHGLIKDARGYRQSAIDAGAERLKLLSTTPEYCKIAAMGWVVGNEKVQSLVLGDKADIPGSDGFPATERDILELFWMLALECQPLCGFNCLWFDLPVIFVRSAIVGVEPTKLIDMKPWGRDVCDPYVLRFGGKGNSGTGRPGKLKQLAPLYGIDVPAGDLDGGCVDELMKTDPAKVGEYVRSDVEVLRALHKRLSGYFWM